MKTKVKMRSINRKESELLKIKNDKWLFRLFIAGQGPKSISAYTNLKQICEDNLKGRYHIEVIDLMQKPGLARDNQILALPALVRKTPEPVRKIIGDLSNTESVLIGLNISEKGAGYKRSA